MRMEILVDNEEPRVYQLDRPKIVVGSHESCDIVIPHKSISRKHIILTAKGDKYYVADQGSTNGSYIDEHRLIPGNSAEFTTFFPIRLGDNVLMTLLSDEDADLAGAVSDFNTQNIVHSEDNESTRTISLKDLSKSSTSHLVQKRAKLVTKTKAVKQAAPAKKKMAASNSTMGLITIALIASAIYFHRVMYKENDSKLEAITKNQPVPEAVVVDNRPIRRIDVSELLSVEKILANYQGPKCSTDIEKYLCANLPLIYQQKWGTIQVDNFIVIVADGVKYSQAAKQYIKSADTNSSAYHNDLSLMMTVLWVQENIPTQLKDLAGMKENSITVAFMDLSKEEGHVVSAVTFVPESLLRLKHRIQDKNFVDAKKIGAAEFSYALDYLRIL